MWDSGTNFDYLNVVSGKKKSLIYSTCSKFTIPSKGVVLLFDRFDYKRYRKGSIWRCKLGVHLNIKLGYVNYKKSPKIIQKLIDSQAYSHLIWLPKRSWKGSEIDLVWNLSHELRHLEQDIGCRTLSMVGYFLHSSLKKMDIDEPKIPSTIPTELDAEIAAWRVARQVIGKSVTDSYVLENAKSGKKQDDFCVLLNCNPENYNIYRETISFISKYRSQLDEKINEASSFYFDALRNVDYIVSKLSKFQKSAS